MYRTNRIDFFFSVLLRLIVLLFTLSMHAMWHTIQFKKTTIISIGIYKCVENTTPLEIPLGDDDGDDDDKKSNDNYSFVLFFVFRV